MSVFHHLAMIAASCSMGKHIWVKIQYELWCH